MHRQTRATPDSPPTVRIRCLGGLDIRADAEKSEQVLVQGLSAAALVHLAVERAVTRDQVIALLWPEREGRKARHSLSQVLYELKGRLGEGWVNGRGERLLVGDRIECDAVEFERAAERGDLEEALRLYRGPFLDGTYLRDTVAYERWMDQRRHRLGHLFRDLCSYAVTRSRDRGDRPAAIAAARRWVEEDPFAVQPQRTLIELLIEDGHRRGALRQYERFEALLRSEGMTPAPEIVELVEDLRDHGANTRELSVTFTLPPPLAPPSSAPRMVVLPFEHLGDPEGSPFTEGITDEITNRLARLPGLGVIARTSANRYRESSKTVAQIRAELGVDFVLEGTVRWDVSSGEKRVRVSPQLIRASDATHLWADTYEAAVSEIFRLQSRIADRVVDVLDVKLRPPELQSPPERGVRDPDVFELCVRARRRWEESTAEALDQAAELFQRAIELDPTCARAYAGLAATYSLIPSFTVAGSSAWLEKADRAAGRAVELDPACADAQVAAGMVAVLLTRDMETAERHLQRALELAASDARAHAFLAYVQCATGRERAAAEGMARAHELDPLSVATNFHVGFLAWQRGDRELAVRQLRLVSLLAPGFDPACYILGGIHFRDGDLVTARREWAPITMFGPLWQSVIGCLEDPSEAGSRLDEIVDLAPGAVHWYGVSSLYTLLGAADRAFSVIEAHLRNLRGKGGEIATAGPSLIHLATDPFFEDLRSDPRYPRLLRRIEVG